MASVSANRWAARPAASSSNGMSASSAALVTVSRSWDAISGHSKSSQSALVRMLVSALVSVPYLALYLPWLPVLSP
ncbi:hypothetical protein BJ970_005129 [Saccharopolyspora phatthalungensis]|uniref:Uncharacterized protein n=1 Tax=Saccharopolyspora phatthalungensis TaxID=664693 RepID=A0A840QGE3_9PSEU|nr:hypothetical protein [Saccharopolyspora phatthalungensis]MBB5157595.1 hypothetical protein [Saccharopolyspora phatthalungensis]